MQFSSRVLGTHLASQLAGRGSEIILRIGNDGFRRSELSRVGCYTFVAASNLSRLIASLGVRNTRDLFDRVAPDSLAIPRLGAVSLSVLGAAFELKQIGGGQPLESWMTKHRAGTDREVVTFSTLKHAQQQEELRERRSRRHRQHERRNRAHRIRVDRFTSRQVRGRVQ